MSVWLTMIACGVLTFAIRLSFIAAEGKWTIPRWFRALLPFVPVATLTALIVPDLLMPQGTLWLSWSNSRLLAGLVAITIAATTRSVLWTLIGGFAALALLSGINASLASASSAVSHMPTALAHSGGSKRLPSSPSADFRFAFLPDDRFNCQFTVGFE